MDMTIRPRRLRGNDTLRRMVRETRMDKSSLIYPMFVKEGNDIREEIPSMDGQYRYSVDCMGFELERLLNAGVKNVMFFGIPDQKDEVGSGAYNENGIVQRALREAKEKFPELYLITDVCMCEYTSHGHCGMLCGHDVDNDRTLDLLAKIRSFSCGSRSRYGSTIRYDGRPCACDPYDARSGGTYRHTDHVLCREICIRLLWSIP